MFRQVSCCIKRSKLILLSAVIMALIALFAVNAQNSVREKNKLIVKGKLVKSDSEWKQSLSTAQFKVMRSGGTEAKGTGEYLHNKEKGIYACVGCGQELFSSADKFDSGSGWPSFTRSYDKNTINEKRDVSIGMVRTELLCSKCDSHLGHVFDDGPEPTGLRYCINSVSLIFRKDAATISETATFGTGCFWCTEALFRTLDGVRSVTVGYMGGDIVKPSYEQVCSGQTGHAEVAQVVYDPRKTSFAKLLNLFWEIHDPTSLNRQGADVGTQYRSAIFYHSAEQRNIAEKSMQLAQKNLNRKIVTEIVSATSFYPAKNYHQNYYARNSNAPYCRAVIAPKLKKAIQAK